MFVIGKMHIRVHPEDLDTRNHEFLEVIFSLTFNFLVDVTLKCNKQVFRIFLCGYNLPKGRCDYILAKILIIL